MEIFAQFVFFVCFCITIGMINSRLNRIAKATESTQTLLKSMSGQMALIAAEADKANRTLNLLNRGNTPSWVPPPLPPSNPQKNFTVSSNGQIIGSLSLVEIEQRISEGTLNPRDCYLDSQTNCWNSLDSLIGRSC